MEYSLEYSTEYSPEYSTEYENQQIGIFQKNCNTAELSTFLEYGIFLEDSKKYVSKQNFLEYYKMIQSQQRLMIIERFNP